MRHQIFNDRLDAQRIGKKMVEFDADIPWIIRNQLVFQNQTAPESGEIRPAHHQAKRKGYHRGPAVGLRPEGGIMKTFFFHLVKFYSIPLSYFHREKIKG